MNIKNITPAKELNRIKNRKIVSILYPIGKRKGKVRLLLLMYL